MVSMLIMEMFHLGLDFFITEIPNEVFTYSETDPMRFAKARADIYPYLLVNIGSGVSMIKVSGPRQYERIGGTSLGGGTLWGLLSLLTGARNFDEMLGMAERGDNSTVDMLVGDIYGTDYGKIGLKSSTIASSFGKVFMMTRQAESVAEDSGGLSTGDGEQKGTLEPGFKPEDISRSILYAVRSVPNPVPHPCQTLSPLHLPLFKPHHTNSIPLVRLPCYITQSLYFQPLQLQQQHRTNSLSTVGKASARAYLFRRLLHPRPSSNHEHALLRHQVLVAGRQESLFPSPRRLSGICGRLFETSTEKLGKEK